MRQNGLFNLFIEWNQPKTKEDFQRLLSFGMHQDKAVRVGKGAVRFYLKLNEHKKALRTEPLERLRREFQEEMTSLARQKLNTDNLGDFFAARIGDIDRAIRYIVHRYDKVKNANPKLADKESMKDKREIDHEIEKYLRRKSY